jgi:hypothetical protein
MDEALSWKPHCDGLLKDCSKALGLLYRFSKYIPKTALRSIADALILMGVWAGGAWGGTCPPQILRSGKNHCEIRAKPERFLKNCVVKKCLYI